MATNQYFNNYPAHQITSEQLLVEDLVIESMQIYGMDVWYLPRETDDSFDKLMGEDQLKKYTKAYPLEMYLNDVTGMEGAGDFISKFGLEIPDEITFQVSRRRFKATVPGLIRAREGDLVYVPLVQNFFEITFVENENPTAMFYTLGRGRDANVYLYMLKLKQFVFSQEIIQTGIQEIDNQIKGNYQVTDLILTLGGTGKFDAANNETVYQGTSLNTATAFAEVVSWNLQTRTLGVIKVNGTFANGSVVIGETSNAHWILTSTDDQTPMDNMFEDMSDNAQLQTEGDQILDFTEHNPFGMP
jgi:hypothetical protein